MENKKVTIYTSGSFGVHKTEATLVDFGVKEYAQYKDAPFVHYIPKGKRKSTGCVKGYAPYIVIIEGHNHLPVNDPFNKIEDNDQVTVKMTRFSCFDDRYKTEFDEVLTEYIKDKTVLMDVRHTVNTNLINK